MTWGKGIKNFDILSDILFEWPLMGLWAKRFVFLSLSGMSVMIIQANNVQRKSVSNKRSPLNFIDQAGTIFRR